jgi:hypothetical protein
MKATTPAYRQAALSLVLQEANHYAARLKLSERLPIASNDLREVRIATPWLEQKFGMLGSIRTENYSYGVAKGNRLVYITGKEEAQRLDVSHKRKHVRPWSELNTNTAFQLATQWLTLAYVDVARLAREYECTIGAVEFGDGFVPNYSVWWGRAGQTVVKVHLFEPERLLTSLHVEDPSLVLRPPLVITNRDELLRMTNGPTSRDPSPPLQLLSTGEGNRRP